MNHTKGVLVFLLCLIFQSGIYAQQTTRQESAADEFKGSNEFVNGGNTHIASSESPAAVHPERKPLEMSGPRFRGFYSYLSPRDLEIARDDGGNRASEVAANAHGWGVNATAQGGFGQEASMKSRER